MNNTVTIPNRCNLLFQFCTCQITSQKIKSSLKKMLLLKTSLFFVCPFLVTSMTLDGVSYYNKLVIWLNTSTLSKYVKLSVTGRRCISSSVNGQFVSGTST